MSPPVSAFTSATDVDLAQLLAQIEAAPRNFPPRRSSLRAERARGRKSSWDTARTYPRNRVRTLRGRPDRAVRGDRAGERPLGMSNALPVRSTSERSCSNCDSTLDLKRSLYAHRLGRTIASHSCARIVGTSGDGSRTDCKSWAQLRGVLWRRSHLVALDPWTSSRCLVARIGPARSRPTMGPSRRLTPDMRCGIVDSFGKGEADDGGAAAALPSRRPLRPVHSCCATLGARALTS